MPGRNVITMSGGSAATAGRRRIQAFALAALCFVLAGLLRVYHYRSLPEFSPADDTALFTTEDALQYRYARMVAQGKRIPDLDPGLHHPEGFDVRRNLTTLVEQVEGGLYRCVGQGAPLHVFLVTLVCFVSSLGVFAAYGTATSIWRSRRSGLFAAALYCVAVPTYSRIIGGYGTEHFALPLLFFGIWAIVAALDTEEADPRCDRRSQLRALVAGLCFAAALAAWHLSRFLFSVVLASLVLVWLLLEGIGSPKAARVSGAVPWLLAPVLAASVLVPILQARPFWTSPFFLTAAVVPVVVRLGQMRTARIRLVSFAGLALLLVLISRILPTGDTGYSHVWGIVVAKIANFGIKPSDPAKLPFEARALWIEDVRSPSVAAFLLTYGLLPLLAVLGLAARFGMQKERPLDPGVLFFGALVLGGVVVYLLFARMTCYCAFFLIVLASGVTTAPRPLLLRG